MMKHQDIAPRDCSVGWEERDGLEKIVGKNGGRKVEDWYAVDEEEHQCTNHQNGSQQCHSNCRQHTRKSRQILTQVVRSVTFHLHKTFNQPVVTVSKPPFEISRIGWGYFTVNLDITLTDGSVVKVAHELCFSKSDTNKDYVFPIAASSEKPNLWDTLSQDCVFSILNYCSVSDYSKFCRTCTTYKSLFTNDNFWVNKFYSVIPDTKTGDWFEKSKELLNGWGPVIDNVQLRLSVNEWSALISARNLSKTDWVVLPFRVNSKVEAWALNLSTKYHDQTSFAQCTYLHHEDPERFMEMIPRPPSWSGYQVLPPGKTMSFSYGIDALMPECCKVPRPVYPKDAHPSVGMHAHSKWLSDIRNKVDSHNVHFPMLYQAHASAGPWVTADQKIYKDSPEGGNEPRWKTGKKGTLTKIGNDLDDDDEIKKIKDPVREKKLADEMNGKQTQANYIVQFEDDDDGYRRRRWGDDDGDVVKKVEFSLPKGHKLVYLSSALQSSVVVRAEKLLNRIAAPLSTIFSFF